LLQVLRQLPRTVAEQAMTALASLPSLGPGEALPEVIRAPMERIFGRSFASVRIHHAPVASLLQAEAFTTGERIVFAPGAFDPGSPRGLTLIGHELAHLGQPVGFKLVSGSARDVANEEEQAAERQEKLVQRIVAQGWPVNPPMEVRRQAPAQTTQSLEQHLVPARAEVVAIAAGPRTVQRAEAAQSGQRETDEGLPTARIAEEPPTEPEDTAVTSKVEIDRLARQVYTILKAQIRAERDRSRVH
jgi:hypothetical protein